VSGDGGAGGGGAAAAAWRRRVGGSVAAAIRADLGDRDAVVEATLATSAQFGRVIEVRLARLAAVGRRVALNGAAQIGEEVLIKRLREARLHGGATAAGGTGQFDVEGLRGTEVLLGGALGPWQLAPKLPLLAATPPINVEAVARHREHMVSSRRDGLARGQAAHERRRRVDLARARLGLGLWVDVPVRVLVRAPSKHLPVRRERRHVRVTRRHQRDALAHQPPLDERRRRLAAGAAERLIVVAPGSTRRPRNSRQAASKRALVRHAPCTVGGPRATCQWCAPVEHAGTWCLWVAAGAPAAQRP
jgi:hypothetical protein